MTNAIEGKLPTPSDRVKTVKKYLDGAEPIINIDPRAPLDFKDPETMTQWAIEMSAGYYDGPDFGTPAALGEAVELLPTSHVSMLRFLIKVSAGRLHVADQSERKHTWLVWNGRIYDEYNQKFTNTITTCLADVMDIVYSDYYSRAADLLLDKDSRKTAIALLQPMKDFIKELRKSSGLFGFAKVLLGDETLSFEEDKHANDDKGYVVEADGSLRHVDNLSVIADPDPTLFITRTLGVCTTDDWEDQGEWSQFLLETFGTPDGNGGFIRDEPKERLLRQGAGVALMGTGQTKHMVHILGTGNSGKSFYLDVLDRVFGDFGHRMSSSAIIKMNGVNFQQDEARGIRFLYISEPDTAALDGPFMKTLTGGANEKITTNRKGISGITWSPQCVLHIVSNDPLNFNAADSPLNNRILTVTAENSVTEDDPRFDPFRVDKIISRDIESVYRWCLLGAQEFLNNGSRLDIPDEVKALQSNRLDSANSAIRWFNEKLDSGKMVRDASVKSMSKMYAWRKADYLDYTSWCATEGEMPYTATKLRAEINKYTGKPGSKNADMQSGYDRLWGVVAGTEQF